MPDLSYCAELVQRHDRDRFITGQFAPAEHREKLYALYAFNIEVAKVRETVSEAMLGEIRLEWWRETIEGLYDGKARHHEVVDALAPVISECGLSRDLFGELIDARAFDLEDRPPKTLTDLKRYAERTSSNLTLLALETLGHRGGPAHLAGRHVGMAWALTGLVRAIPFHARQRRVYLPEDLMAASGIGVDKVIEAKGGAACRPVVKEIVGVAREHLTHARVQHGIASDALAPLLPAVLADGYLDHIERADYDVSRAMRSPGRVRGLARLWWRAHRKAF